MTIQYKKRPLTETEAYQRRMWDQVRESLTQLNLAIHAPPHTLLEYTLGDFVAINDQARKLAAGLQALEQIAHGHQPPKSSHD